MFKRAGVAAFLSSVAWTVGAAASDTVTWLCHHNDKFTVLETPNRDAVGTTFVTRKSAGAIKVDCVVETRPTDVVIGRNDALYYIALKGSYLVLDAGTGPDRWVKIFDLRSGKAILDAPYSISENESCVPTSGCSSDEFKVGDASVIFWRAVKQPATAENCPAFSKIKSSGLDPTIEEKTSFGFATMKPETLKAKRCVPSQAGYQGGYKINGIAQD